MKNLKKFFAYDPKDSEKVQLEKFAIFLVATACTLAGIIWSGMYYVLFKWNFVTFLPAGFVLFVGLSLIISHKTKNHFYAIYAQIICIMYITAFIQWSLGGVYDSGFVISWAILGPICALMFFTVRKSLFWFGLFLVNILITVIFDDYFVRNSVGVADNIKIFFFLMNVGISSVVVFVFASYYVNAAIREQEKANKLLKTNLQQKVMLQQSEKLSTLGKLSAGVAHELNNPGAATQSSAMQLKSALDKLEESRYKLGQFNLSNEQIQFLQPHLERIIQIIKQPVYLDPLSRSDKEYEIENWLEGNGLKDAWDCAPILVNLGYDCEGLGIFTDKFAPHEFPVVISVLCNTFMARSLVEEITRGTERITEIVKALKSYSYLDQAPQQSVDVHEGLNDTLLILKNKLKKGIKVATEFSNELPKIEAYGSELNQVWTNIIDNAADAMKGQGQLTLKTHRNNSSIFVDIVDNGPGIPQEIQNKIFDPFFTTKSPGEGTGLGLNISYNIITQKHKGQISVSSKPGETCFRVVLPITLNDQ